MAGQYGNRSNSHTGSTYGSSYASRHEQYQYGEGSRTHTYGERNSSTYNRNTTHSKDTKRKTGKKSSAGFLAFALVVGIICFGISFLIGLIIGPNLPI